MLLLSCGGRLAHKSRQGFQMESEKDGWRGTGFVLFSLGALQYLYKSSIKLMACLRLDFSVRLQMYIEQMMTL